MSLIPYDYSSRGELLSVNLPDGNIISYVHDPVGRRIAKKVNGTITEKYLWQGMTQLLAVYNGSNNLIMRFEYADARMPVAMTRGGETYYLAYDQVGSLKAVSDESGSVIKTIDYDSFGNIINDTNPSFTMPISFAGGLYDADTKLVRFGYRDYDPDIGRWTAKDPILFDADDIDLYGYCLSDPINLIDPGGLDWLDNLSNFSAGFGDTITFGGTKWIRDQWNKSFGWDDIVDPCSGFYKAGKWSGYAWEVGMGASAAPKLFGKGALLNSNRYLRIGVGRKGGDKVFRVGGNLVKNLKKSGHIDIFKMGKL